MPKRVHFNIRGFHYAPVDSVAADGVITYGTIVPMAGSTGFTIDAGGADKEVFYADGEEYYVQNGSTSKEAELTIADIVDSFRKDILGEQTDGDGDLWENENDQGKDFAFGFIIDSNEGSYYYWYQLATAGKPSLEATTNEENKVVQPETLPITVKPNRAGNIRVRRFSETDISADWFSSVKSVPTPITNATRVVKKEEE